MSRRFALAVVLTLAACSAPAAPIEEPEEKVTAEQLLSEAQAAESGGQLKVAVEKYRQAIRLEPAEYDPNRRLVELLIRENRAADAVEAAKAYKAASPEDLRGNHLIADAQLAAGNYSDAAEAMSKILQFEDDAAAYEKRGRARVLGKDLRGGEEDYRKAVELEGDNVEYLVGLASVLIRRNQEAQAKQILAKALEINSEHPRANIMMGIVFRSEVALDDALKHHLRAARVAPENARAHFELGITYNLRGDNIAAEASLARAVELEPGDGLNWYAYGEVLRLRGKIAESLAPYRRAVELMPKHDKAPNKLGYVLFKLGKVAEAEVVLTAAVRNNPDDPYPYFNLGMVYAQGEKLALAINSFQRFLDLAPDQDKDIPVARRQIRELKRKLRRQR